MTLLYFMLYDKTIMHVFYFNFEENNVQKKGWKQHADFQYHFENDVVFIFHNTFMPAPASIEGQSQHCLNAQTTKEL